jgi:hypothetical protein
MKTIGVLLVILGVGSFFLHQFNMEFLFFNWIDNWGTQSGNYIRIGSAVLGILLIIAASRRRRIA